MLRKIMLLFSFLSLMTVSMSDANAAAPAPTTTALLKRIIQLESEIKKIKQQNDALNYANSIFFNNQKLNNSFFDNHEDRLQILEDAISGTYGINKDIKTIKQALNDPDGIICRLKQVEKDIYKNGTSYHIYEPVCVTY